MAKTFTVCAKTDCKWNEDGVCQKSEIFVDDGVRCASYEPEMAAMPMGAPGLGAPMGGPPAGPPPVGQASDIRSLLLQRMAGAGGGPTPTGAPGAAASPMGAGPPPPRRF